MKTRFSRKLHMAFAAMLTVTLALAWYFFDSVKWFEHDIERVTVANSVLNGYRILSAETRQKLRLVDESVTVGRISDLPRWHDNTRDLRTTIINIRHDLGDELALMGGGDGRGEMGVLNEMETLAEAIIASGEVVRLALEEGRLAAAAFEAEQLRARGTAQLFNELMVETLAARGKALRDANSETIALAHYITGVLPLFMLTLTGLTVMIAWLFSRSLTRSVNVLYEGAGAFTRDDLAHRIPELNEMEFERLGKAFNAMAKQLSEQRAALHDSNVRLEAIVDERTRALKTSNEILELADENRRKLLADISHEFRTPLTVIRGEAEIALRGKVKSSQDYQDTLERIMEQADATTRLVDDLLFIARADAGEPRLDMRPVSVNELLKTACIDFSARAEKEGIAVEQVIAAENAVVMGDAGRLRQVFTVLIDNALRYSKNGDRVEVGLHREERDVIITVQDTGIGLTREESRQAFQRFFRGNKAQGHARGTGLGLPVAKAIVEAHKGTISLEGEPGKGAMATVILPAEEKLKAVA